MRNRQKQILVETEFRYQRKWNGLNKQGSSTFSSSNNMEETQRLSMGTKFQLLKAAAISVAESLVKRSTIKLHGTFLVNFERELKFGEPAVPTMRTLGWSTRRT
jgi:hypothetical protein